MTPPRPRILFVSPCWPLGRSFGGRLRALHTARALKAIGDVTVLVAGSGAADAEAALLSAAEFKSLPAIVPALRPNRTLWDRVRWAVDLRYLNVHGFAASAAERARVLSCLHHYDLAWVLNARTPSLLQIWRWPRSHLDLDDIPSSYLRRLGDTAPGPVSRLKARTQRVLLHRRERHFGQRFSTLSVCSEADRAYLGHRRVHVIPNGFSRPAREPRRDLAASPPRLGFIGLYSYAPNLDGVRWFLQSAWPAIRRALPGVRFRLIGQDTTGPLRPRDDGVDALGWLDDPADEIATWSAMVVPIRLGGGTRLKLPDAFSRKCPVVSTRFGAHGYQVADETHLLLADRPADFARACVRLVQSPEFARHLAENAWREFLHRWTWDAIAPRIWAAAEDCLRQNAAPAFPAVT